MAAIAERLGICGLGGKQGDKVISLLPREQLHATSLQSGFPFVKAGGRLVVHDDVGSRSFDAFLFCVEPGEEGTFNDRLGWIVDQLDESFSGRFAFRYNKIELMRKEAFPLDDDATQVADLMLVKPFGNVFEKEVLDIRVGEIKKITHGKNGLQQKMILLAEIAIGSLDQECVLVVNRYAEAGENLLEPSSASGRRDLATGHG